MKWEDVSLNDPVSGTLHWVLIPMYKVNSFYERDNGLYHDSNYFLRQYYLNKPLTKLNYDESKFDYRNLEFLVSQNFSQKTNVEISYWDRRGGGEFSNSEVAGNQIFGRIFHQLNHRQALKLNFLNNKYTIGESFGYNIPNLENFAFNRFLATPNEPGGESEIKASTISLNYYRRGEDTTRVTDNLHAGVFYNSRSRGLEYSADSTFYKVQAFGANARKWITLNPMTIEGGLSYRYFLNEDNAISNLAQGNWGLMTADAEARLAPFNFFELTGGMSYRNRTDGFDAYRTSAGAEINLGRFLKLTGGASRGTIMPTPQQLYWNSNEFQGNTLLVNEDITESHARVALKPFRTLELGIKGQIKEIENSIMVGSDSTFANMPGYQSISVTPFLNFNNSLFEFSGSATYHQFENSAGSTLLDENERIWLKGSAYVKGYLFNRAAYIKFGVAGMFSPFRYRAAHYNPVLDFWQPLSNDQLLPPFNRLDVDVSARVRKIMIHLKWENVLDDVNQLGYFESAGYPMTQRRFIFGIRAFFRN